MSATKKEILYDRSIGIFPSLKDVVAQTVKAGVKMAVCEQSCGLLEIPCGEFMKQANIVGATTLDDLTLSADAVFCF